MMKKTPGVRKDGKCYVCKGPRRIPETRQKGVPESTYKDDPFCSTNCARVYWDNPLTTAATST